MTFQKVQVRFGLWSVRQYFLEQFLDIVNLDHPLVDSAWTFPVPGARSGSCCPNRGQKAEDKFFLGDMKR